MIFDWLKTICAAVIVLKWIAGLLKLGLVKIKIDLPGEPILWQKIKQAREDRLVTSVELNGILDAVDWPEYWRKYIDFLQGIVERFDIKWSTEGEWGAYWDKVFEHTADNYLDGIEIGMILDTLISKIRKVLGLG